jgi:predicted dehydrogenase
MINAAIVGLGRWGKTLVEAVQDKSERLRFTHAVSRGPDKLRDYGATYRLELVGSIEQVLADPGIDAVVLATPHSLHCAQIIAVAAAGKAVFCEKPLTMEKAEAERGIEACRAARVVLGVGTDKRFFPAVQELLRLVKSGELGQILHVEAHFSNEVARTFTEWRFSSEESPAGGMTGTGIHVLDMLIAMAGPVRQGEALLLSHKVPPDPLDSLSVLLEFEAGVSGTLAVVRSTPLFMRIHAFARHASAEVLGRTELVLRRSGAEPQTLTFAPADSVRANLEAFANAAAGRAAYPIPTEEMLNTVAAFETVAKAILPGRA